MKFDKKYSQCPSVKVNVKINLISNGPVLYIYPFLNWHLTFAKHLQSGYF